MTTNHSKIDFPTIYGFNKTSEAGLDVFAPAIFLGGCNFKCPFCMNARLVCGQLPDPIDISVVKEYVKSNGSEWLMVGGGEPTIIHQKSLEKLLNEIKSWGCKIGICTNGSQYHAIYNLINYFDYIALDIKSGNIKDYKSITEQEDAFENVVCCRFFCASTKRSRKDFDYEVRTTLYPPFVTMESLQKIGALVGQDTKWILQQFRHNRNMVNKDCDKIEPYTKEEIEKFLSKAKEYCSNVTLRYV